MHIYLKPFNLSQSQFHCHFLSHSVRNTYQLHWMNYLPRNNRKTNDIRSYMTKLMTIPFDTHQKT